MRVNSFARLRIRGSCGTELKKVSMRWSRRYGAGSDLGQLLGIRRKFEKSHSNSGTATTESGEVLDPDPELVGGVSPARRASSSAYISRLHERHTNSNQETLLLIFMSSGFLFLQRLLIARDLLTGKADYRGGTRRVGIGPIA
jgi:hypothetical protein